MKLVLGTRGSPLALAQSNIVKRDLRALDPAVEIELRVIRTSGDALATGPLTSVGGKGLFTKELEDALLAGDIDLAVHSMKDVPAALPAGLRIGCIPERASPFDVMIHRTVDSWDALPKGLRVGTTSLRRAAQLREHRPDFQIVPLRGNVDTRLRKLDAGEVDAVVLAAAGLERLGLRETHVIELETHLMIPAIGQGALCIETAETSRVPAALLERYHHADSAAGVTLERAVLEALGGDCRTPIGVHTEINGRLRTLRGVGCVIAPDGARVAFGEVTGFVTGAAKLGRQLAAILLANGGEGILNDLGIRS